MSPDTAILRQIYDPANRANPYPLWARLPSQPPPARPRAPADRGGGGAAQWEAASRAGTAV